MVEGQSTAKDPPRLPMPARAEMKLANTPALSRPWDGDSSLRSTAHALSTTPAVPPIRNDSARSARMGASRGFESINRSSPRQRATDGAGETALVASTPPRERSRIDVQNPTHRLLDIPTRQRRNFARLVLLSRLDDPDRIGYRRPPSHPAHSSRGPGRRPLTAVTRVQIPYALPTLR